ncbi:MAG: zinc ribbon domain-containing protein [Polaromonas sp.]
MAGMPRCWPIRQTAWRASKILPSSKTCSQCGSIRDMSLSARRMVCECGCNLERDLNAALNMRRQALALQSVERTALAGVSAPVKPASAKQKVSFEPA